MAGAEGEWRRSKTIKGLLSVRVNVLWFAFPRDSFSCIIEWDELGE